MTKLSLRCPNCDRRFGSAHELIAHEKKHPKCFAANHIRKHESKVASTTPRLATEEQTLELSQALRIVVSGSRRTITSIAVQLKASPTTLKHIKDGDVKRTNRKLYRDAMNWLRKERLVA